MQNRLILKLNKFQLPPPKRLGTVVKNILGAIMAPPCQIGLKNCDKKYGGGMVGDNNILTIYASGSTKRCHLKTAF